MNRTAQHFIWIFILMASQLHGSILVQVCDEDAGKMDGTIAKARQTRGLVQLLCKTPQQALTMRRKIQALDLSHRISAACFDGRHLPYIDNLVNRLVVSAPHDLNREEMMRVLVPNGQLILHKEGKTETATKPRPETMDDWTHYLYDASNNAVSHDRAIGPPRHMQWSGAPAWTRNHHKLNSISCVVTAAGRLFFIVDKASAANTSLPSQWYLVARDAFNGTKLWEKAMGSWAWERIRFRSGPPQVTRLLVASENHVLAPLSLNAPISLLNAKTGKTSKIFNDTLGAEEIILQGDTLLAVRGSPVAEQAFKHPAFNYQYKFPNKKIITALSIKTGKTLWTWKDAKLNPLPETLAADGQNAYFQTQRDVVCVDLAAGQEKWRYQPPGKAVKRKNVGFGPYTLVVHSNVVLCNLSNQMTALSADKGKVLWSCPAGLGFRAPMDIFVIDNRVYLSKHPSNSISPPPKQDFNAGRDLLTGRIQDTNTIMVDLQTQGHHHRCYRNKATQQFILTGKRGIEMMDLTGDGHSRNNWLRGSCQYGIMPANGLLYSPSHSCGCYMESMLHGFWALRAIQPAVSDPERRPAKDRRLEKGPAFEAAAAQKSPQPKGTDWPVYRGDALRSGVSPSSLPGTLKSLWTSPLSGRLTPPVIACGSVVIADRDKNIVYGLDDASGKTIWTFPAADTVDSPPAIHGGNVYFGTAGGWVYCLTLADGKLVWRFQAAPADLRTVAMDRVASLWPVHGSVLIFNGLVYCAAGRSTWLDGGIVLYALDPATGAVKHRHSYASRHPVGCEGKDKASDVATQKFAQNATDYKTFHEPDRSDAFSMAGGALSDVLVSDGTHIFMHQARFSATLAPKQGYSRHLFSTSSLLDGAENHRSHWVLGTGDFRAMPVAYSWIVHNPKRWPTTIAVPTGVQLAFDDNAVWGTRRMGDANGRYYLYKRANMPFSPEEKSLPDFRKLKADQIEPYVWKQNLAVRPRAILKAGDKLYIGAMPTTIPGKSPNEATKSGQGGQLLVFHEKDGTLSVTYDLPAPVVWDGMAAAGRKLYMTTQQGQVICMDAAQP